MQLQSFVTTFAKQMRNIVNEIVGRILQETSKLPVVGDRELWIQNKLDSTAIQFVFIVQPTWRTTVCCTYSYVSEPSWWVNGVLILFTGFPSTFKTPTRCSSFAVMKKRGILSYYDHVPKQKEAVWCFIYWCMLDARYHWAEMKRSFKPTC